MTARYAGSARPLDVLYSAAAMGVLVPSTLDDAVAALGAHPDALVLAGGTDLMVEINERPAAADGRRRPSSPSDGSPSCGRGRTTRRSATVRLGAGVTYAELAAPPLAELLPALAQAARTVGSPQIRNAATIGGNVATCSPAGDGLPVLAALDATVELLGPDGVRTLPVARVHDRRQAHGAAARRADHGGHRAACSTAGRATPRSVCATPW